MDSAGIYTRDGNAVCVLRKVSVAAVISGVLAETTVSQVYVNDQRDSLEVYYTFPLPPKAMVSAFTAQVGSTRVKAEVQERSRAQKAYRQALDAGDSAFLLERHRDDVFQISLGRVEPEERVTIEISYIEEVVFSGEDIRWVLPTVVAPRYVPDAPGIGRTGPGTVEPNIRVPDADYITPPVGDAPYHLEFSADVSLPGGVAGVSSPSHTLSVSMQAAGTAKISLATNLDRLDRDLVLFCRPCDRSASIASLAPHPDGGFVQVCFTPEIPHAKAQAAAREYQFMLDISGSMEGEKLEQAKQALRICLRNLESGDRFNIIAFESRFKLFRSRPVLFSQQTLEEADRYIAGLCSTGGTEIYEPLAHILGAPAERERIVFLFTDGQVGNETEVIDLIESHNLNLSLFPFGIDTAVNAAFIEGVARAGNGLAEYVYPGERLDEKIIRQFARLDDPYLENVTLFLSDGTVLDTAGPILGRLYSQDTYHISARLPKGGEAASLTLRGKCGGIDLSFELPMESATHSRLVVLAYVRDRIAAVERGIESVSEAREEELKNEAVNLSLQHGLLSRFTGFVATMQRKEPHSDRLVTTVVPVALPHMWEPHSFLASHMIADSSYMSLAMVSHACVVPKTRAFRISGGVRTAESRMLQHQAERDALVAEVALCQSADGSLGKATDSTEKTARFVLGLLYCGADIVPYRKQLRKAGLYLLTVEASGLAAAAALEALLEKGILDETELGHTLAAQAAFLGIARGECVTAFFEGVDEGDRKDVALRLLEEIVGG